MISMSIQKLLLTNPEILFIIKTRFGVWRSLVSRLVRDQEAAGSSPATPTNFFWLETQLFLAIFAYLRTIFAILFGFQIVQDPISKQNR